MLIWKSPSNEGENVILFQTNRHLDVSYILFCLKKLFQCQVLFVSFKSNTTGVTSGAGTINPSRGPPVFSRVRVFLVGFVLLDL